MDRQPLVSIIMSVYNCEKYIAMAVDSILEQTMEDLEFIIVDDGSTDRTLEILDSFKDRRMKVLHQGNTGQARARNRAIEIATGEYIAIMDGDDTCSRARLEKQLELFEGSPELAVVSSHLDLVNGKGQKLPDWEDDLRCLSQEDIRKRLPYRNCIAHAPSVFRASVLKLYKYRHLHGAEDYDLFMRIVADGCRVAKHPSSLYSYLVHSNSTLGKLSHKSLEAKMIKVHLSFLSYRVARLRLGVFELRVAHSIACDLASLAVSTFRRNIGKLKRRMKS